MFTNKDILGILDVHCTVRNLVLIPFCLLVLYYAVMATDRFASEAVITVKEEDGGGGSSGFEMASLGMGGPAIGYEDEHIVIEYLLSRDILARLDEKLRMQNHYKNDAIDWLSSLSSAATFEEFHEYFLGKVEVDFDDISGLIYIETQAFSSEVSKSMLDMMLYLSEEKVNAISHQLALDKLDYVQQQLNESQNNLKKATENLLVFQNKYQIFSPEQESMSLTSILDVLEAERSHERATLRQLLGSQKPDSPQVKISKERIRALSEQISDEKKRLVGEGDRELNDLMVEYTNLQLDLEFSKDAYASTLALHETARAEVSQKMKHVVIIDKPILPEEAKYPSVIYILVTAAILLLMFYGIVRMLITTIKEHQD